MVESERTVWKMLSIFAQNNRIASRFIHFPLVSIHQLVCDDKRIGNDVKTESTNFQHEQLITISIGWLGGHGKSN